MVQFIQHSTRFPFSSFNKISFLSHHKTTQKVRLQNKHSTETSVNLTINSRGVHDECPGAGGLDPGHVVHTGLHEGDLQTELIGGGGVVQAEVGFVEQAVQRAVPGIQIVVIYLICKRTFSF